MPPWVGLPTKTPFDRDGGQRTGADGKPAYSPVLDWSSRKHTAEDTRRYLLSI
jgi:hypothetical protein